MVSRLNDPRKDVQALLRAYALARREHGVRHRLVLAGRHALPPTDVDLIDELGLRAVVDVVASPTDAELAALLRTGSLFALASREEGLGVVFLEAMASGLPVVAADSMALPHLIDGNGSLFTPGDEHDLAAKLTAVLGASDEEYLRMKRRSLEMIEAHDINRTLSTFEALYRGETVAGFTLDARTP